MAFLLHLDKCLLVQDLVSNIFMLTRQKQLIDKVFKEANRPLSRDEVLVLCRKRMSTLGSATVDRAIRKMSDNFELVGLSFPGQPTAMSYLQRKNILILSAEPVKRFLI